MNHIIPNFLDVDLVIITIAYLLVFYSDTGAGIFAFCLGIVIDIFSAGPVGLFALLYMTIFWGIKFGSLIFDFLSISGQVILITLAVLLKEILFLTVSYIFSLETILSPSIFLAFASSAVCSGLISPIVFHFYNRLNRAFLGGIWKDSMEHI